MSQLSQLVTHVTKEQPELNIDKRRAATLLRMRDLDERRSEDCRGVSWRLVYASMNSGRDVKRGV